MNNISLAVLKARIDYLRLMMLGTQKELGALTEDHELRSWPELREQVAVTLDELVAVKCELTLLHQQSHGQHIIDACFPRSTQPGSMQIDDSSVLASLLRNAVLAWIKVQHASLGHAVVSLRCELDPNANRHVLVAAGILSPIIDIQLDECESVKLHSQAAGARWGEERIVQWEVSQPAHRQQSGGALHRIQCSQGTHLELTQWGIRISEALD